MYGRISLDARNPGDDILFARRSLAAFGRLAMRVAAFLPFVLGLGVVGFPISNYYLHTLPAFEIFPALFLAAPLFDVVIGQDKDSQLSVKHRHDARFTAYNLLLWIWSVTIPGVQLWTLVVIAAGDLRWVDALSLMASAALISAVFGIPVAHELIHRRSRIERALAELLMCAISYPLWCVGHVHGHHFYVATDRDPATARLGESYYRFLPRAYLSELKLVYVVERERMAREGRGPFALRSRLTRYAVELVLLYGSVGIATGWIGIAFLLLSAAMAAALLHLMNYVQHYGLIRREVRPGVFEPIGPQHSWNTTSRYSNASLLNLGRHADHHLSSTRPFYHLRHLDETRSPHLPFGVPLQFLMALFPPLWFRYMNPRVRAVREAAAARPARVDATLDDLELLSASVTSGTVQVEPVAIDVAVRRAVFADRINQFGLWLFVFAIFAFVFAYSLGGVFGAYSTLIVLAGTSTVLRRQLATRISDRRIVGWALNQPWNWPRLWRDSQIRLTATDDAASVQSPVGDWIGLSRAHAPGLAA